MSQPSWPGPRSASSATSANKRGQNLDHPAPSCCLQDDPHKCGLEGSSQRHVECCSQAWDKDSTCCALGQGGGRLTSLGNTVLGLAEQFCFSSANTGRQTLLIEAMSSLSPHANNSGGHPLTHSNSQDLRIKLKWSFQSPLLTAVFPSPSL